MKKRLIVLVMFSILVAGCSLGVEIMTPGSTEPTLIATPTTSSPASTITPPPAGDLGFGEIHGTVTDAVTGTAIAGALITCEHQSFTSPVACSGTATTDVEGLYVFENVYFHDTDTIKLTVQAPGYQTQKTTSAFFRKADLEVNVNLIHAP